MAIEAWRVRAASQSQMRIRPNKSAKTILTEASEQNREAPSYRQFDVFLCHAHKDEELVLGIKELLEQKGNKVYVDWVDDPNVPGERITSVHADRLRHRMNQSKKLVYLHTHYSSLSKWCPWELGYFDKKDSDNVFVAFVAENENTKLDQEYLRLYILDYIKN